MSLVCRNEIAFFIKVFISSINQYIYVLCTYNFNMSFKCLFTFFLGRGKKHHEMLHKILPLFVLPFLVQSAIVPFLVSKLKLLLLTSILVGKVAIFLLIISAMKQAPKHHPHYETGSGPSYWGAEPSRRTEFLHNGYKFDRPAWGN